MKKVVVSGSFDNINSRDLRFLEEASKFGPLHILLWSDEVIQKIMGAGPRFPHAERQYFLDAVRFVDQIILIDQLENVEEIPLIDCLQPGIWVVFETEDSTYKRDFCSNNGIQYHVLRNADLKGFPVPTITSEVFSSTKKVVVTGCFDWFHSGHIRFFEETSQLGDLYVVVGHDKNVRLLKGEGHPLYTEDERRYMAGSVRFVKQALVSSGSGWMDAEPEIEMIQPDIYAVNEDGDKPNKRAFCEQHGLAYVVLNRAPRLDYPNGQAQTCEDFNFM